MALIDEIVTDVLARAGELGTRLAVAVLAILVAATLAFPSVRVADVLASLGIVSVAAGFAFKDVLENLLAGAWFPTPTSSRSGGS